MPSDPLTFDELKLPFIFVPHGDPEPTDWLARHPDYIKLPATFVPRGDGPGQTGASSGNPPPGQRRTLDGLVVPPDPTAPWPSTGNAKPDAMSAAPHQDADRASTMDDPIAAFLQANDALATASDRYASGHGGSASPDVDAGSDKLNRGGPVSAQAQPAANPSAQSGDTSWQGVAVRLPDGQNVPDTRSATGNLMSPVADLSPVAAAGRATGAMYRAQLSNPNGPEGALPYLFGSLDASLGHAGTFDYQRKGNFLTGYTQLPQFRDVSNFNVGLFCQQAGLTLDETLTAAGSYAGMFSSNARHAEPHDLDQTTARFIIEGFNVGQSGAFGKPTAP